MLTSKLIRKIALRHVCEGGLLLDIADLVLRVNIVKVKASLSH
jgi:hypothetical protein